MKDDKLPTTPQDLYPIVTCAWPIHGFVHLQIVASSEDKHRILNTEKGQFLYINRSTYA